MQEPIKAGDVCRIVRGFTQGKSPNVGKVVTVGATIPGAHGMPHSRFGRIVHVSGEEVYQLDDGGNFVNFKWAHIPVDWLEKIDPDTNPDESLSYEKNEDKESSYSE